MLGRRAFLRMTGGTLAAGGLMSLAGTRRGPPGPGECLGATLTDSAVARFRSRISGAVILPAEGAYPSARLVYNRRFNPYPTMIVRPADEIDVARTIEFARTHDIRMAIRSGGHSYIGASGGTGIVVDLSLMNNVVPLGDGLFRVGAGAKLQEVYGALLCNGNWSLPSGSCGTVGFGGIAQGGGFGYLQREHGLTCDRVRAARLVLADSSAIDASPQDDDDLHWAIRGGGGGSFGVATHFDVEAVPYQTLHVMVWFWPLNLADEALAKFVQVQQAGALARHAAVALVFDRDSAVLNPAQCICVLTSTGTLQEAQAAKSLFVGPGGIPETPGLSYQYDAATPVCNPVNVAAGYHFRAKSAMVYGTPTPGTGAVIRECLERRIADPALSASDPASMSFFTLGGAVGDVAPADTAFPHRNALLEVQFLGYVLNPTQASVRANDTWMRQTHAQVFPGLSAAGAGCYVNYADDDLPESQWPALYWGDNYARLQATKRRVDPTNVFNGLQTVRP